MANRILVVEDEADTREVLTVLLGHEGYLVDTAENGREALALLAVRSYDVILSNLHMPEMSGEDLYRRIDKGWPHLAPRVVEPIVRPIAGVPPEVLTVTFSLKVTVKLRFCPTA